jgi:hypothetical protein
MATFGRELLFPIYLLVAPTADEKNTWRDDRGTRVEFTTNDAISGELSLGRVVFVPESRSVLLHLSSSLQPWLLHGIR